MMMSIYAKRSSGTRQPGRPRGGLWMTLALSALAATVGCDGLLDVPTNPDEVGGDAVEGEGAFDARLIGMHGDFTAGFDNAVVRAAQFTNELLYGGPTRQEDDITRRDASSRVQALAGLWTGLHVPAKASKDLAEDIAAGNFPNRAPAGADSEAFARSALLAGYTRALLADLFCTTAFDGTGPELTAEETYGLAEDLFARAIQAAEADPATRSAALVGRARVRLQLGDQSGALADAAQVEEEFEFMVEYSSISGRLENGIFGSTWNANTQTVAPEFRNATIDDTDIADPRVDVIDSGGLTFNGALAQFNPLKYGDRSDPIRLASWFEAQYIIAELEGGDVARDIINDIRSRHGIGVTFDPERTATEEEILDKILEERGRTLFLEGQKMPDLRRFRERHGIDRYRTGPEHGDQVCLPLPDLERASNPGI
jgi:hypothetical protein